METASASLSSPPSRFRYSFSLKNTKFPAEVGGYCCQHPHHFTRHAGYNSNFFSPGSTCRRDPQNITWQSLPDVYRIISRIWSQTYPQQNLGVLSLCLHGPVCSQIWSNIGSSWQFHGDSHDNDSSQYFLALFEHH